MVYDRESADQMAAYLLEIGAVKLRPRDPFTWASGWRSPIYCDNRLTLSYPRIREFIKQSFAKIAINRVGAVDIVAGVATGGIAHGALVADKLSLPFVYVRSGQKQHGLENRIEGKAEDGQKVLVIEDLISTGMSSVNAIHALDSAGLDVKGLCAVFSYGFEKAEENMRKAHCPFYTITDYLHLIQYAVRSGIIAGQDEEMLIEWYKSPATW